MPRPHAEPGQSRGRWVEHVGDSGRGHERRQHRGEELQRQADHHQQPDEQRDALGAGGLPAGRWRCDVGSGGCGSSGGRSPATVIAAGPRSRHRPRPKPGWMPPRARSARSARSGRRSPKPDTNRAAAISTICSAVFSFETYSGRMATGMAQQRKHRDAADDHHVAEHHQDREPVRQYAHAARVTYMVTSSALSATGSSRRRGSCRRVRRASQPSTASDRPAASEQAEGQGEACSSTSQTASGTAQRRPKVTMLGSVSARSVRFGRLVSVRHRPASPGCCRHLRRVAASWLFRHQSPFRRAKPVAYGGPA